MEINTNFPNIGCKFWIWLFWIHFKRENWIWLFLILFKGENLREKRKEKSDIKYHNHNFSKYSIFFFSLRKLKLEINTKFPNIRYKFWIWRFSILFKRENWIWLFLILFKRENLRWKRKKKRRHHVAKTDPFYWASFLHTWAGGLSRPKTWWAIRFACGYLTL